MPVLLDGRFSPTFVVPDTSGTRHDTKSRDMPAWFAHPAWLQED